MPPAERPTAWPSGVPDPPGRIGDALILRWWRPDDAAALAEAWADPELRRWLDPPGGGLAAARRWVAGEPSRRAGFDALDLVAEADGAVAGEVGFRSFEPRRRAALVGYWVGPTHRGRGLGAAALAGATAWCLDALGADAVVAECDPANRASWRTAEAAGFELLSPDHQGRRVYAARGDRR